MVSILIPAHNVARWVAETLASAVEQTWLRKEIILVDDGSTDETLAIARKFCSGSVAVVGQEKQGAAAARNKALALSQGDFIQWLDADDLLAPDKIERQMAVALEGGFSKATLFSGPWAHFYYRTKAAKFHPTALWCNLSPSEWFITAWNYNLHMQTATWLTSRELAAAAGPWDVRLLSNDDGEYFSRVIKASDAIIFVPQASVFYRVTGSNRLSYVHHQSEVKVGAQLFGLKLQMQHALSLEDSERTRSACVQRLQTWFQNYYPQAPKIMRQADEIVGSLGGQLKSPRLSWKYRWIQKCFGWNAARTFRIRYGRLKSAVVRLWDLILFYTESRRERPNRCAHSVVKTT